MSTFPSFRNYFSFFLQDTWGSAQDLKSFKAKLQWFEKVRYLSRKIVHFHMLSMIFKMFFSFFFKKKKKILEISLKIIGIENYLK